MYCMCTFILSCAHSECSTDLLPTQDLVEFAKVNDVRLMTHNDDSDILPQSQLQTALEGQLGGRVNHTHWSTSWVTRYTSIIKLRGIIAHKG